MRLLASFLGVFAGLVAGCASVGGGAGHPKARASVDLASARVIDLSHAFDERTLYWPTSPTSFQMTTLSRGHTPGGYFYSAYSICTPEHGGTHLDAPIHFSEAGRTLDQIPVEQLVAPAVVIDVSKAAAADPDYRLGADEIRAWEQRNGTIPAGAAVLLRTGWADRWPDRRAYFGDDTPGDASNLHFPSFGQDAAELLVRQRKVAAIGVDTASIDHGPSKDFIVHRVAAEANVLGFENLANLASVPETGAWIIALPMKIAGGSGGPLRIVALVAK